MFPFADKVSGGKLKYESYIVDKKMFLEECKNAGLLYLLIRINNDDPRKFFVDHIL